MAKTTVTLAGKDACLIIRESGTIEVVGPDTSPAPDAVTLLLAVADHVLTDPDFCEDMLDYMDDPHATARIAGAQRRRC